MVEAALDEIAKWQPGTTIDTRDAAQSITLQIIVQAVFGIEDRNLREYRYVTVVKAMMRDYIAPFMFFPALRRAPFGLGPWRRFSTRWVDSMPCCRNRFRTADTPAPPATMTC